MPLPNLLTLKVFFQHLHDMFVQLQKLEMEVQFIVHFTWCSDTRMIFQRTDGLLRGELSTVIMQGIFFDFMPLNESTIQRYPTLKSTVSTLVNRPLEWRFLGTKD